MFHDMPSSHGILKATTTPQQMLDHISKTHGKACDHRLCMETAEKAFNASCNAKAGIETHFVNIEEAADKAKSLGSPHTNLMKPVTALTQCLCKWKAGIAAMPWMQMTHLTMKAQQLTPAPRPALVAPQHLEQINSRPKTASQWSVPLVTTSTWSVLMIFLHHSLVLPLNIMC